MRAGGHEEPIDAAFLNTRWPYVCHPRKVAFPGHDEASDHRCSSTCSIRALGQA